MPAEAQTAPPASAPASSRSTSDDRFAAGLAGDDEDTAVAVESEPSKPAFDPKTVDWYRTKESDVPDDWKPYQKQLKAQLAEQTRANQEAAELRREVEALRNQQATPREDPRLAQALERLAPKDDPYADLPQRLDPEEQGAIDVVQEIINRALSSRLPDLNPVQGELQQLRQAVTVMAQYMQSQQQTGQIAQLREAYEKHGEALQSVAPNIRALIQTPKPGTDRNWTVLEAADLLLGATTNDLEQARQKDREERGRAKRQVSSPAPASPARGNGELSDADVRAQLRELGFTG